MSRIVFEPLVPQDKHHCDLDIYMPSVYGSAVVKRECPKGTIIECECGRRWIRVNGQYGLAWARDRWWRHVL